MNNDDVLVKWRDVIPAAINSWDIPLYQVACIRDLAAGVKVLRERVAELETDARLGQMVREMPRNAKLGHEGQQWGEWYAVWPGDNHTYNRQYGSTPEEAMERAMREET